MITALLIGALGVFTWQHDGAIRSIKNDNTSIHQQVDWQNNQIQRHEKGLNYLYNNSHATKESTIQTQHIGPVASWMDELK